MWHLLKCLTVPSPTPLPCSHEAFGPERPSNLWVLTNTLTPCPKYSPSTDFSLPEHLLASAVLKSHLPREAFPCPWTRASACPHVPFAPSTQPSRESIPGREMPDYLLTGDLLQTRSSRRQRSCLECSKRTRNERMNGVTRFCFLPSTGRLTPGWCWDCGSFPLYVVILLIWCHGIQMSVSMLDSPAGPWAAGGTGVLNSLVHSPIHTRALTRVFFFLCFSS